MYQVLAKELIKNLWIAGVEVGHNKSGFAQVEVSTQETPDGIGVLLTIKLLCDDPASDIIQQSQSVFLGPTIFRMLLVIEDYLDVFHRE
ncbi:MAG TPA: hypothetical protein ENH28_05475 [Euryarchaeota archaeon]|nr:hypothetical protein BMS3Bbin15_01254 [archaeon BMS3Bbin15]HDL15581.1 hypothetical protein [Euryarchaeota archaeon]